MITSIHAVADFLIQLVDRTSGDSINLFKLQKMVYYAQAWHLTLYEQPLFDDEFEAWVHGPVSPELHRRFRHFDSQPIGLEAVDTDTTKLDVSVRDFLDEVWTVYGKYSVPYLEKMSHDESPWQDVRVGLAPDVRGNRVITQEAMCKFYSQRITARKRIREA
jgi:uncharacterized phage-associated protein